MAMEQKQKERRSVDGGSAGSDERRVDDDDESAAMGSSSTGRAAPKPTPKSKSKSSKPAAFRQRIELHVQLNNSQLDNDVIDLASPAQSANEPTTQQHADDSTRRKQHRDGAADSSERRHDEHNNQNAPAAAREARAAGVADEFSDTDGRDDADEAVDASDAAEASSELTYEVERVEDRRFNAASIRAGCCVAQPNDADGQAGAVTNAESGESGATLLPEDEWDEGCSGQLMQRKVPHSWSLVCWTADCPLTALPRV